MHSYQTLAVLALAVSTASPAISAPIQREDARSIVNDLDLLGIAKTVGSGIAFGALPPLVEHLLGGNSTRRDLDERAPAIRSLISTLLGALKTDDPLVKVIGEGILGGVASGGAAVAASNLLNNTRRAFALSDLEPLLPFLKTAAGIGTSLVAADGVEALFGGNSTNKREPAGILSDLTGIIGEDGVSLAKLVGTGLLAGFTGATGSKAATAVFNHTRREPGILGDVAEFIGEDGVSIAKLAGAGLLGGFTGAAGSKAANAVFSNNKREPAPFELGNPGDVFGNLTGTLDPADDLQSKITRLLGFGLELPPQSRDLIDTLQLLSRRLNELD